MKRIFCLLLGISFLLLFKGGLEAEIPDKNKTKFSPQKIEDTYWFAKGGKIELKQGTWRFGVKEKILHTKKGKVVDEDYILFCRFTITNNSDGTYKVNPFISLLDRDRATLYRIPPPEYFAKTEEAENFRDFYDKIRPFQPQVLVPGEGYTFEDDFSVSREIAFKTSKLKLKFAIEEVKEE